MEQKRPSHLLTDKHTSARRRQNEETVRTLYLLTHIATSQSSNRIIYLSSHCVKIVTLKKGIYITPARSYRVIDELADTRAIARTEFKYQCILTLYTLYFLKRTQYDNTQGYDITSSL